MKNFTFLCTAIVCCSLVMPMNISAQSEEQARVLRHKCRRRAFHDIMSYLTSKGLDINVRINVNSSTCLMEAVRLRESSDVVQELIQEGANVNARTSGGRSALIYAASYGKAELASVLISAGADINVKDEKGRTPLMYVASSSLKGLKKDPIVFRKEEDDILRLRANVAKLLIDKGVDIHLRDSTGASALFYAAGCLQIRSFHPKSIPRPVVIERDRSLKKRKENAKRNVSVRHLPRSDFSNKYILSQLIQAGADVNIKATNESEKQNSMTLLLMSATSGLNLEVMNMLIQAGSDLEDASSVLTKREAQVRSVRLSFPDNEIIRIVHANRKFIKQAKKMVEKAESK